MKLIELHIRNIASIEKGDINFDNDLIDLDTGLPAQKFLICGDTGTGKSILLDSITLALFKKTPRIEGLESKRMNKFMTSGGNEVNISSIEQYTRLGISEKDDCYAEVYFEANNGKKYSARLELGLSKSKNKGKEQLHYSKPNWILKADGEEWQKVDSKDEPIANLIGMTYEQFNRMAMLAQGQFATFLCGDKNERADILERLTNTEIFSRYGEAIKELTQQKKNTAAAAKERFEASSQFLLDDNEVNSIEEQIKTDVALEEKTAKKRKRVEEILDHLKKQEDAEQKALAATAQLSDIQALVDSDTYKEKQLLLDDWDATEEQRNEWEHLQQNQKSLNSTQQQTATMQERFLVLTAGLQLQITENQRREATIAQTSKWIAARKGYDQLYENAKAIVGKIDQHKQLIKNIKTLQESRHTTEKQIADLQESIQKANLVWKEASKSVAQQETVIENLRKALNELNPALLDEKYAQQVRLATAFERLNDDWKKLEDKKSEQQKYATLVTALESEMQHAITAQASAQKAYDTFKSTYEKALQQYTTLNSSLEETLVNLRHRMSEEHTSICPLCGQPINELLSSDAFSNVVLPYKETQEKARQQTEEAQRQLHAANDTLSSIRTKLNDTKTLLQTLNETISKTEQELSLRIQKSGLNSTDNIENAIKYQLEQIEKEIQILSTKKQAAVQLQKEIEEKRDEIKPFIQQQQDSERHLLSLQKELEHSKERIDNLTEQIQQGESLTSTQERALDDQLTHWFAGWREDLDSTQQRLEQDADQYLKEKKQLELAQSHLVQSNERIKNMSAVRQAILAMNRDWATQPMPTAAEPSQDVTLDDWNELSAQVTQLSTLIQTYTQAISRSSSVLDNWRQQTGKELDALQRLIARKSELQMIRQEIGKIATDKATWGKILQDAQEIVAIEKAALERLYNGEGASENADLPRDKQQLTTIYEQLKGAEAAAHDRLVKLHERMNNHLTNKRKTEEASIAYLQAKKSADHWELLNKYFGGSRFRNLAQTHILKHLLRNANVYLRQITDRYQLTCSEENEQLSILVSDQYHRNELRSAAVLSGGEKFMISLALALALSSFRRPDMNVNILFIDEGFGTLDQQHLDSVMKTLGSLQQIATQNGRRVGIISHREELLACIPNKIKLIRMGEGRSRIQTQYEWQ